MSGRGSPGLPIVTQSISTLSSPRLRENHYLHRSCRVHRRRLDAACRSSLLLGVVDIPARWFSVGDAYIAAAAGHDVTGCFQLVGYPEWWPRNSPQLVAGKQQQSLARRQIWARRKIAPQTPRPGAINGGRSLEEWANSASVRQARSAAEIFSRGDLHAGEEDGRGPGGPIYSEGQGGGPSSSSNGPGSTGLGLFPALVVDQWSTLLTALKNSNNTQSEKLSGMENL
ncbi:hypothetical protein M9H77_04926 [Catharanthus roseus]|uniref:Uncharacterized protein n=1 Tax=Catharanthus roseus TaxID=4058 RepID=A0ACC0CG06_CATRO|nr:hypothetical protein M9H77_04926 [Catharanthus roseus]